MPKITVLSKLFIDIKIKLPEFGQEVLLYMSLSGDSKTTLDHYEFGSLKSVTMTEKGKQVLFTTREGKEIAASHWTYLVPPAKEQPKEATKETK